MILGTIQQGFKLKITGLITMTREMKIKKIELPSLSAPRPLTVLPAPFFWRAMHIFHKANGNAIYPYVSHQTALLYYHCHTWQEDGCLYVYN